MKEMDEMNKMSICLQYIWNENDRIEIDCTVSNYFE